MNIFKRGKVWWCRIRMNGRLVRRPLSTDKVVALQKVAELRREKDASKYGYVRNDITWEAWVKKYLAIRAESNPHSLKRDKAAISTLTQFAHPRMLTDVTVEVLDRWKASRAAQGLAGSSINRDLGAIKAMMRKAQVYKYLSGWDGSLVSRARETHSRLLFYNPAECARLLVMAREYSGAYDLVTIALLGLRAGLRRSEIHYLAWTDVDFQRGLVAVAAKDGWQPKGKSAGHVPLPKDLLAHLKALPKTSPWVIGDRPSVAVMSVLFRKLSHKAGLAGGIHTLRHTYASHLVQAGVPLYTVSKLLRHSSIKMTEIYAHLAPDTLEDAVSRLPKIEHKK